MSTRRTDYGLFPRRVTNYGDILDPTLRVALAELDCPRVD